MLLLLKLAPILTPLIAFFSVSHKFFFTISKLSLLQTFKLNDFQLIESLIESFIVGALKREAFISELDS